MNKFTDICLLTNTPTGYIIFKESGDKMDNLKECCECSFKKKERSEAEYKSLINRLNRIEGQVRGLKRMLEDNSYCTDILTQTAAVSSALDAFSRELLGNHIKSCVAENIRNGNDEIIDELLDTLRKMMK